MLGFNEKPKSSCIGLHTYDLGGKQMVAIATGVFGRHIETELRQAETDFRDAKTELQDANLRVERAKRQPRAKCVQTPHKALNQS